MSMISVNNLTFTYPKTTDPAIRDISFEITEGEIFGFLGPSGAGKSTTQKILIKLLRNYQGSIQIMGKELRDWDQGFYERLGVSFELPNHYLKLTAMENLNYFASLYSGETADPLALLEAVGLKDAADMPVSQFSKGMKVRLNVARSLLNKPKLLFLDEPTSGLDPVNARVIKDLVLQQREQGTTVFVTTHNMMVADELCDRVGFIVDGKINLIDSPEALKLRFGERKVKIRYHVNGHTEDCDFALDGLGDNNEFIQLLKQREIETIHTKETTLENIFIQVTGRELA
jgi:fluoroquinolone transport system ATP-binding protein